MNLCLDQRMLGSPLMDAVGSEIFLVGQAGWVPTWLTPLWLIGLGLACGALFCLVVYGVLALLSFVPGLGTIPDSPRRGVIASLLVGGIASVALCILFIRPEQQYSESLYLPSICIGLILGFGLIYGMWHRTRAEWKQFLTEGVVPYLLAVAAAFGVISLAATPLVGDPMGFIRSIAEVNFFNDGTVRLPIEIAGTPPEVDQDQAPFVAANVEYNALNASTVTIESNRTVLLADSDDPASFTRRPFRVNAGEKLQFRFEDREIPPLPQDPSLLFIQNREYDPANVVITLTYVPEIPQVSSIVTIALSFFLTITGLMVFRQAAPRVWALALSTAKNEMAQPLYLLLLAIGLFLILLFGIYPFNTLGDDIRVLKDSGVTMIMVLAMLQAIWSAGTSVTEEIDGRTALTVLSKPVSRRSFILGKYAGIMLSVLVLFVMMARFCSLCLATNRFSKHGKQHVTSRPGSKGSRKS